MNRNNRREFYNAIYFDSSDVEYIRKEIKKFIGKKNLIRNIYRIQSYDSLLCRYFCIGFIGFMLKGKSLLDYTNLLSPNDYEENDKIMLKNFQLLKRWKNYIVLMLKNFQ